MGNIVLLDELTINKIAAGEVIERPASVIKEMVENSIDAGATTITVEIRNGGISYIRIVDNGKGIAADDLEMAFERHATSKIRNADDLQSVKSMGFRGEALASIAAVANVELVSKTADQIIGNRIIVEGGNILTKEEAACSTGTIITVQNLFYNTPVRYKFLKKDYTESGYIEDVMTQIALIHPEIAFKFINTGKTVIQTTGNGDLTSVIYSIYGKDVADAIIVTDYKYEDISVKGVVGKPEIARSNRGRQIFFVNKRFIKDKTLSAAVTEAFKGLIPIGKFGFVVLDVEMDPSKVDVNVHPAKLEVRFEEENKVFKAVYHTIKDALLKSELVANTSKEKENVIHKPEITFNESSIESHEKDRAGSFFSWRKNKKEDLDDAIDRIGERDNIISQIYNDKHGKKEHDEYVPKALQIEKEPTFNTKTETVKPINGAIDTSEILEQLKQLQEKMQRDAEEAKREIESMAKSENIENKSSENIEANVEENSNEVKNENENNEYFEYKTNTESETQQDETMVAEQTENYELNNLNIVNIENANNIENTEMTDNNQNKLGGINTENESFNINDLRDAKEESSEFTENNEEQPNAVDLGNNSLEKKQEDTKEKPEIKVEDILEQNEELKAEFDDVKSKIDEMLDNSNQEMPSDFTEMYLKTFGIMPPTEVKNEPIIEANSALDAISDDNNMSLFEETEEQIKPTYRFIGIVFKTYIILEMNNEFYMFDQHAAHERVLYEKVKNNYYSGDVEKNSQLMLLPDVINLTHKEMDIARENMEIFEKAGFVLEEFGENTIKLSGVPDICLNLDTKELFLETLDEINTVARTAKQEIEERFLATVACKAAVKAGMTLSEEEVHKLMNELLQLPNPFTCPHGRPIAIKMTKYDLEKRFSRK